MATEVVAFVCDFCPRKKRFAAKGTAARHERRCFYNPTQQACATCNNFTFYPYSREPEESGEGGPYCSKDMLNNDPESSTQLRSQCEGWELRIPAGFAPPGDDKPDQKLSGSQKERA